jgi:hypothetical protein
MKGTCSQIAGSVDLRRTRWRKAMRASTKNVPCGGASSNGYGRVMEGLKREELLMKLDAARAKANRVAWRLIDVEVAPKAATSAFALNRDKLRKTRRREGRYLLRTNLCDEDPAKL